VKKYLAATVGTAKCVGVFINALFEKYKFARRSALYWAMGLITYSVLRFFDLIEKVGAPQASVIVAIIGLLSVVIGLYNKHRSQDEQ
jgi:hypothetical protein